MSTHRFSLVWLRLIAVAAVPLALACAVVVAVGQGNSVWYSDDLLLFHSDRDGESFDLYMLDPPRRHLFNLTRTPNINEQHPRWSPDGDRIAYLTSEAGNTTAFIMDVGGRERRKIAAGIIAVPEVPPSWSPDGEAVAVYGQDETNRRVGIFILGVASGTVERFEVSSRSPGTVNTLESIYACYGTSGDDQQQCTSDDLWRGRSVSVRMDNARMLSTLDWSSSGEQVAFVYTVRGRADLGLVVRSADAAADELGEIVLTGDSFEAPVWSPDGTQIAYIARENSTDRTLHVYDLGTQQARQVSFVTFNSDYPHWGPDGRRIAFWSRRALYVVDVPTGFTEVVDSYNVRPFFVRDGDPQWRPR